MVQGNPAATCLVLIKLNTVILMYFEIFDHNV